MKGDGRMLMLLVPQSCAQALEPDDLAVIDKQVDLRFIGLDVPFAYAGIVGGTKDPRDGSVAPKQLRESLVSDCAAVSRLLQLSRTDCHKSRCLLCLR